MSRQGETPLHDWTDHRNRKLIRKQEIGSVFLGGGVSPVVSPHLHDLHLQVFMERRCYSDCLQHLAEQLLLQDLHLRRDSAHEPVLAQELLGGAEKRQGFNSGYLCFKKKPKTLKCGITCIPASAVCPSLVFLDSSAICRGSRQRSLEAHSRNSRNRWQQVTTCQSSYDTPWWPSSVSLINRDFF